MSNHPFYLQKNVNNNNIVIVIYFLKSYNYCEEVKPWI